MFNRLVAAFALLLFMAVPFSSARAAERPESEVRERVEEALRQRHPKDTPEWWRSLGTSTPRILISMIGATDNPYHRVRMTEALAFFPDDAQAVEYLKKQAETSDESVIRNAAVRAVATSQGEKELPFVSRFLKNPDSQTRLAAAQSIKRMGGAAADAELERYSKEEKATWILARLKGEFPKPSRALEPTGSSEDRLDPRLEGSWSGYWIYPRPGSGLESEAVTLKLQVFDGKDLRGDLTRGKAKGPLAKVQGKGSKFSGRLPAALVPPPAVKKPSSEDVSSFEGELLERAGTLQLRLESPKSGASLILRKNGA